MSLATVFDAGWRLLEKAGLLDTTMPRSYADDAPPAGPLPIRDVPDPAAALRQSLAAAEAAAAAGPRALTVENVEAVLDELVRPALHADGGDIALVRVQDGDVYVRLVGSCSSCPSSVMTMRMGVERLLQDEFPDMVELIQVSGPEEGWDV